MTENERAARYEAELDRIAMLPPGWVGRVLPPEEAATVRLNKAAPDLLAACKTALYWHFDGTPVSEMSSMERATISALESAIAKAEGGPA